jgi:hypothetical protein
VCKTVCDTCSLIDPKPISNIIGSYHWAPDPRWLGLERMCGPIRDWNEGDDYCEWAEKGGRYESK